MARRLERSASGKQQAIRHGAGSIEYEENLHEGLLYETAPQRQGPAAAVCPRLCVIAEGKLGICKTRQNVGGKCYTLIYDEVVSVAADPIEKKPLFHFHPGTTVLSLGTLGCNMRCMHCQNWQIAHADAVEDGDQMRTLPAENLPQDRQAERLRRRRLDL